MLAFPTFRYVLFGLFALSVLVALGSWAIRGRRLNPFGRTARTLRAVTDPVIVPLERWLLRRGRNPQQAPWWLVGIVVVGGIVALWVVQWGFSIVYVALAAERGGPRSILQLVIYYTGQLLTLAIIVRVIGSWLGVTRYNRWMRPAYWLTDWIVRPISRFVPPFGMFDLSPLVAWFLIYLLTSFLLGII